MIGGQVFKKMIFSSWFLAAVPAIIILLILPGFGSRYKIVIEPQGSLTGQSVHEDLNSDSVTEYIRSGKGTPYYYIIVFDFEKKVHDQWNLPDEINATLSGFFTGNFDHDKFREIYIFTHKGDSLFLNINEFFEPAGTKMEHIFITKIGYLKGEVTSTVRPAGFWDENKDGKDELYFCVHTGFGLEPRRLFSFDISQRILKESKFTGAIFYRPRMADVDGDGKPEFFGYNSASGNYKTKAPYTDWSAWLMVFNDKLDFSFPPVEFKGFPGVLDVNVFRGRNVKGYILSHTGTGADSTIAPSQLALYSPAGKLIKSRKYKDLGIERADYMFISGNSNSDKIFILDKKIHEFNEDLDEVRVAKIPFKSEYMANKADINFDGKDEFLLYSDNEQKLYVYNSDFKLLAYEKCRLNVPGWQFSKYIARDNQIRLFLSASGYEYMLSLTNNKFYYLGYFAYPAIYFFFFILIILTKRISAYQVIQKESLKNRLVTLQLQSIKSQIDPHFTFNALNSIASLIYHEDKTAAYDYMNKVTRLLRGMLNDAEKIYRSLGDEIVFVKTYLDLEKLRFDGRFNYEIVIGEGVTRLEQVPKLVLHTFAENSVKHGLMSKSGNGFVKISIIRENDYLKLCIEDNGIGRVKAAGKVESTGKGLKLTGEFYSILNKINKKPIRLQITDLYKASGEPAGTRVEVFVPVEVGRLTTQSR